MHNDLNSDLDSDGIRARTGGRALRFLTGLALVAEGSRHLIGASWTLIGRTAGVVVAEFAFYVVLQIVIWRFFRAVNPWLGAFLAVAPVGAVFFLSDAPGRLGTLLFVGVSLLVTAARADGGCEVMTLPGMMFGRRTHLVCIAFSPIDWVEERMARRSADR